MLGFGFTNQTSGNGTGGIYNYGIGQVVGGGGDLDGNITQFQIYGSALSNTDAEALSNAVSEASVPEPSTLALLSAAFVGVFAWNLRRRVRSLKLWPSFTSL
ncbi:MAG: PEP-CTERM sorting domain-containing protein [Verrucomicrobiota bacterium]